MDAPQSPPPQQQSLDAPFDMQWQPTDTSSLQPAHLSLSRVPRTWERKPLSPFSRSKMRVGKVWKRAAPVEIRSKRRSLGAAAGKPVKKMRLDGDGAAGVARWEGDDEDQSGAVGSPARKIVLRRDRVGEEGLMELPDEEEGVDDGLHDEQGAIVEIFDEEGTLLDVGPEDVGEQQEWEDEEEEFNPTMMHLGDIVEQARRQANKDTAQDCAEQVEDLPAEEPGVEVAIAADLEMPAEIAQDATELPPDTHNQPRTEVALPEGFVSPVKQTGPPPRPSFKQPRGSRRRTLPTEWRPSRLRQVTNADDSEVDAAVEVAETVETTTAVVANDEGQAMPLGNAETDAEQSADPEWEDVEDEEEVAFDLDANGVPRDEALINEQQTEVDDRIMDAMASESVQPASPVKLPSSPVPSVEGQHPRLPLRRSPRRKSSSPVKQSSVRPSAEQSHLVALTPIKGLGRLPDFTISPFADPEAAQSQGNDADTNSPPPLERSVSAPPEEPAISPHRPSRPRVSDDAALLQAFLNRAAESKNPTRRISATKRESITNRRDSDAVRQALASPAKPEVLGDLDPNSPSPRKPTVASDEIDNANILPGPEPSPLQKTRRSGRATRKAAPQTATPVAAPNKISIRGNSENVVLKKSEAQELSQITRTNTRKNKGGSVLPLYRLAKLQQHGIVDPLDDGAAVEDEVVSKPNKKGRTLRWNETLVEVWQGGDVSETSLLSDELNSTESVTRDDNKMDFELEVPDAKTGPPPPAETPSKPKIRRLKAPRTAAAPGKAPAAPIDSATISSGVEMVETAAAPSKASKPTKRRSRIATPAKALSNASLLPADLEPTPAPAPAPAQQHQQPKKSIPTPSAGSKRKPPPNSKLPAPATSATSTTTALGQGKENLISSPPKKKPAAPSAALPTSKTFAPKLDFSKSLAPQSQEDTMTGVVPGLASPAKKVGRKGGVVFAPATSSSSMGNGGSQQSQEEEVPLGLSSPAKKRTRRAVAGGH